MYRFKKETDMQYGEGRGVIPPPPLELDIDINICKGIWHGAKWNSVGCLFVNELEILFWLIIIFSSIWFSTWTMMVVYMQYNYQLHVVFKIIFWFFKKEFYLILSQLTNKVLHMQQIFPPIFAGDSPNVVV